MPRSHGVPAQTPEDVLLEPAAQCALTDLGAGCGVIPPTGANPLPIPPLWDTGNLLRRNKGRLNFLSARESGVLRERLRRRDRNFQHEHGVPADPCRSFHPCERLESERLSPVGTHQARCRSAVRDL